MEKKGNKKGKPHNTKANNDVEQKQQILDQTKLHKKAKNQQQKNGNKLNEQNLIQKTQNQQEESIFEKNGRIFITIRAKPGAKTDEIFAVEADYIGVAVQAPPLDGQANDGVLEFLASVLDLKKRDLTLVKGMKGHDKIVQIDEPGQMSVDQVLMKLMAAKS